MSALRKTSRDAAQSILANVNTRIVIKISETENKGVMS